MIIFVEQNPYKMKKFIFPLIAILIFSGCSKDDPIPAFIPRKITILSANVTQFPSTNSNGAGWDFVDGPDIYMTIDDGITVLYTSSVNNNVAAGTQLSFPIIITITDFAKVHAIGLWDKDSPDDDDIMTFDNIKINDYLPPKGSPKSVFPNTIELKSVLNFKVTLNVIWLE